MVLRSRLVRQWNKLLRELMQSPSPESLINKRDQNRPGAEGWRRWPNKALPTLELLGVVRIGMPIDF